jgi:predicted O-methyltransferase YrrM
MSSAEALTMDELARSADGELGAYRSRVGGVPYERKGILFSEMFFFTLCARRARPARILESGRARAQSTLLLAVSFPELPILSLEHDPRSVDVPVAAARMRPYPNVELRFGDATRILPAIARQGDVALIDGPKGFRAVRLALHLLAQGRLAMVFLHDVLRGSPERAFLERWLPATLYSDDPRFARVAHVLDAAADDIPEPRRWRGGDPSAGYGYSLACLQHSAHTPYLRARIAALFAARAYRG